MHEIHFGSRSLLHLMVALFSSLHTRPVSFMIRISSIRVAYADPVIITVNACARNLIKFLKLLAADLADLPIGHINLIIIA